MNIIHQIVLHTFLIAQTVEYQSQIVEAVHPGGKECLNHRYCFESPVHSDNKSKLSSDQLYYCCKFSTHHAPPHCLHPVCTVPTTPASGMNSKPLPYNEFAVIVWKHKGFRNFSLYFLQKIIELTILIAKYRNLCEILFQTLIVLSIFYNLAKLYLFHRETEYF